MKAIDTEVRRAGMTSRYWYGRTSKVTFGTARILSRHVLTIDFDLPSKGGGTTQISVRLGIRDFFALVRLMFGVDQQKTMEVISREMSKQVTSLRKLRKG